MTALRCVKVPEWQEENLAADGKNRYCIGARKNCSQGAAPRAVIFQRQKMSHSGRRCMQNMMVKRDSGEWAVFPVRKESFNMAT